MGDTYTWDISALLNAVFKHLPLRLTGSSTSAGIAPGVTSGVFSVLGCCLARCATQDLSAEVQNRPMKALLNKYIPQTFYSGKTQNLGLLLTSSVALGKLHLSFLITYL